MLAGSQLIFSWTPLSPIMMSQPCHVSQVVMRHLGTVLPLLCLATLYAIYNASLENVSLLSPQGCRMSWMNPMYIRQDGFDASWTRLSARYSLWLYREEGWDTANKADGNPVLFITGNAGSSQQSRSIASSAARQFYSSPGVISPEFLDKRPVDMYAVEFNEDLSALHGPTIESQREYVSDAITYILSLYPSIPQRRITIIGHSMGGIVARSLLAPSSLSHVRPSNSSTSDSSTHRPRWTHSDIAAVITMSAPNGLAPVRFSQSIESIYDDISRWEHDLEVAEQERVPLLAICGGSTDSLVMAETCTLPPLASDANQTNHDWYRETVHTTALPGIWTGVGHREMVWCHQVRWRVARVALELGMIDQLHTGRAKAAESVLRQWFPSSSANQHTSSAKPSVPTLDLLREQYTILTPQSPMLRLVNIGHVTSNHLVPIPASPGSDVYSFTLLLAKGTLIHPDGPQPHQIYRPSGLRISLYHCPPSPSSSHLPSSTCVPLEFDASTAERRLLPLPLSGKSFPDAEGVDESEGIVFWKGRISETGWIAVHVENGGEITDAGTRWLVGTFEKEKDSVKVGDMQGKLGLIFNGINVPMNAEQETGDIKDKVPLRTTIKLRNLIWHALLIYKVEVEKYGICDNSVSLQPMLHHTSFDSSSESQYHVPSSPHPTIYLHTHVTGPFLPPATLSSQPSLVQIYTSGSCGVERLRISVAWRASFGRIGGRYWSALAVWTIGIVGFLWAWSWREWEKSNPESYPNPTEALTYFTRQALAPLGLILSLLSLVPLSPRYLLGNAGEPMFSLIAPLVLVLATGVAWTLWGTLVILIKLIGLTTRASPTLPSPLSKRSLFTTGVILTLMTTFITPVQLIYVMVYLRHLRQAAILTRATSIPPLRSSSSPSGRKTAGWKVISEDRPLHPFVLRAQHQHILLLLTALFPLVGPVLIVWIRTLATAGVTAPFRGDHNILHVIPFALVAETTSSIGLRRSHGRLWASAIEASLFILPLYATLLGARYSYGVYDVANLGLVVLLLREGLTQAGLL